jgi:hypothetical protein
MSVCSRHGHQKHGAQQLDADDKATGTFAIFRSVQSGGAPSYDTIHFDLKTGFDVLDCNRQKRGQAGIQIDPHSRTGNVIDDFYGIHSCRGLQQKFSNRLTYQWMPLVSSLFDYGHSSNSITVRREHVMGAGAQARNDGPICDARHPKHPIARG